MRLRALMLLGLTVGVFATPAGAANIDATLSGRIARSADHAVRVVVKLNVTTRPEAALSPEAVADQRRRIRVAGARALRIARNDGRVLVTLPYVTTVVDRGGLTRLRASTAVRAVSFAPRLAQPSEPLAPKRARAAGTDSRALMDYGTGAAVAWAAGFVGRGQGIAVLDSGVDSRQPWFRDRVVSEACFSGATDSAGVFGLCPDPSPGDDGDDTASSDGPSYISGPVYGPGTAMPPLGLPAGIGSISDVGHGTIVAGAAAGAHPRFFGFPTGRRGMAPDANIIAVNVNSARREQTSTSTDIADLGDLLAGMDWVNEQRLAQNLRVVNLSLGWTNRGSINGPCDSTISHYPPGKLIHDAIKELVANGVSVVAAAGNTAVGTIHFPACLSQVISVGALDTSTGEKASFTPSGTALNILAPGTAIVAPKLGGGTGTYEGSSLSAALVSGAIALYREKYPSATPTDIKYRLMSVGRKVTIRKGVARRALAVDQLLGLRPGGPTGTTNPQCIDIEFLPATMSRPSVKRGFIRLTCAPTRRQPQRLVVTVEGPGAQWVKEVRGVDVPLAEPAFYALKPVTFGPAQQITTRPDSSYKVCYLLYGTEDMTYPTAGECQDYET